MLTWILGVAAGCIVLAALLYFAVPARAVKVPAIVLSTVGGLGAGAALGIIAMAAYGQRSFDLTYAGVRDSAPASEAPAGGPQTKGGGGGAPSGGGGGGGGAPGGGGPPGSIPMPAGYPGMDLSKMPRPGSYGPPGGGGGGGGGGMGGMMGGMGGRGPNSKNQLATLVTKLDVLTRKPLSVSLTDEQKTKVREQLKGLEDTKELSQDEAKKRLDALLDVLKDDKATFEAAGFRWPGEGGGGGFRPAADTPNPFTTEANSEHLKSLRGTVGSGK